MARSINPEKTGPGNCKRCGEFAEVRKAFGLCRHCYDQQRKENNAKLRAKRRQRDIDQAPAMYTQWLLEFKWAYDRGLLKQEHHELFSGIVTQYAIDFLTNGDWDEVEGEQSPSQPQP